MTNGEKLKEIFPDIKIITQYDNPFGDRFMVFTLNNEDMQVNIDWWNAEYKEPTTRNCFGCRYAKDNHNAGTEECHLCMWENQYTPTTKDDLGVDTDKLIADCEKMSFDFEIFGRPMKALLLDAVKNIVKDLPSVTPIRPKGHWIINKEKGFAKCSSCKFLLKDKDEIKLFGTFVQGYNYCPNCGSRNEVEE